MRVLVLDRDYSTALAHAIQLSGHGLVVETVHDINEAACRLSAMMFDAVVCTLDPGDDFQLEQFIQFQHAYPATKFYTQEQLGEFFGRIKIHNTS